MNQAAKLASEGYYMKCWVFLYNQSKKVVLEPIASAMAGTHRDCLVLDSNDQQPKIQFLASQNQTISTDHLLLTDGQLKS